MSFSSKAIQNPSKICGKVVGNTQLPSLLFAVSVCQISREKNVKNHRWGILCLSLGGKGDFGNLGSPSKTPFLPLLNQFTEPCEGCPTAIYSLSIGMYSTVNYSMPIYALFYSPYIIIYIYVSADYPV